MERLRKSPLFAALSLSALALTTFTISELPNSAVATKFKAPTEWGNGLLQHEQKLPINPLAVLTLNDGIVFAETSGQGAWSATTDTTGNILFT